MRRSEFSFALLDSIRQNKMAGGIRIDCGGGPQTLICTLRIGGRPPRGDLLQAEPNQAWNKPYDSLRGRQPGWIALYDDLLLAERVVG